MVTIWARWNIVYLNDEGTYYMSIKGTEFESTCHFPRHHMSSRNETTAPEKADTEDKASRPLIRHSLLYLPWSSPSPMWTRGSKSRPWIDSQRRSCLVSANSLRPRFGYQRSPCLVSDDVVTGLSWLSTTAILGPRKVIATSSWPLKEAILGLEWRGNDLDLTFNDCHTWSRLSYRDLELAISDGHAWSRMTH